MSDVEEAVAMMTQDAPIAGDTGRVRPVVRDGNGDLALRIASGFAGGMRMARPAAR